MLPNVILYKNIAPDLQEYLAGKSKLTVLNSLADIFSAEIQPILPHVEAMIGVGETIDSEILDKMPNLRVLSTISVGYDNFNVSDLTKRGISLMHTPDVLTETTADMIFLLILGVARRITELLELVRSRKWDTRISPSYFGTNVHGKKLGIVGMGRIGYAVAKRGFAGFGMEIVYYNRSANERANTDFQALQCSLEQVLKEADFVCVTLPLSADTRSLIGRSQLALMKPEAFLINGGRGDIVDEEALVEVLNNGTISGAGLDVYEHEPLPLDSPLLHLKNVVTLPHIGSATHETRHAMAQRAIDNMFEALSGGPGGNYVNPAVVDLTDKGKK